jgi:hypothetical protein
MIPIGRGHHESCQTLVWEIHSQTRGQLPLNLRTSNWALAFISNHLILSPSDVTAVGLGCLNPATPEG